jgi:dipeptidyl aminopeptidase/acylaminoacyl peptidase
MKSILRSLAVFLFATCAYAQDKAIVTPPETLLLDGLPPIPAEVATRLKPYGDFRPHSLWSWHPTKRQMLIARRLNATTQVHLVTDPGASPRPLTDETEGIATAEYEPTRGEMFLFTRGEGGNEQFQIYRHDGSGKPVRLTDGRERASAPRWSQSGERIVYTTQPVDRNNPDRVARTTVHLMDPMKPEADRVLGLFDGGGWGAFRFSEDGRQLVYVEYVSRNESHLWVMDVDSGNKRRVTKPGSKDEPVSYRGARFTKDGKGLIATTDRGSEFHRLVYIPIDGGPERILTENLRYDVEGVDISFDANLIAFTTNENGSHALRFMELDTFKELPRPPLMPGIIGGLEWRQKSSEIGFHMASARSSGDVFSYDVKTNKVTRWTNGNNPGLNTSEFPEPRLVKWKSFDGLEISGFLYHPGAKFSGKRPVIINIHGGPEAQARPGFIGRNNYYVTELGIAMIYPNVRGSAGFGKTFLKLDNGMKREDSVKDIGALLDWVKAQPDLDGDRVMVIGGSYGGYMTLACAFHFADRIASAVSSVGISNFVTFLERTETYRRDLRRVEYGDERNPEMRAFLEKIAPLNHADEMTKPLFVVSGFNDPRVPYTEGEQIVKTLKAKNRTVWYMLGKNEGHGFAKKPNADYLFYAIVEFAKQTLLK